MKKIIKNIFKYLLIVLAVCLVGMTVYLSIYYHGEEDKIYLEDSAKVQVKSIDNGLLFDGPGTERALIFYPGAKVETEAYAPLMSELAEGGIDCFLVDMPGHMAFLGMNRAEGIMDKWGYAEWYIGGHSLGGAMAASWASKHQEKLEGLLLLAAYSTKDLSGSNLKVVSVYGSDDGVLNMDTLISDRKNLPADSVEKVIEGGNHAQFACYGEQRGDGEAKITQEDQRRQTVQVFLDAINKKQ